VHDPRPGTEICGVSLRRPAGVVRGAGAASLVAAVHRRYIASAGLALPAMREFLASDDDAFRLVPESAFTWDERSSPATAALREAGAALPLEPPSFRDG
jgi:hypothetical protein